MAGPGAAQGRKDRILARLSTAEPPLTDVLLTFLEPGAQQEAAKKLLASEHAGAQLAAVKMFDEPYAAGPLIEALQSQHGDVRIAAAETLARHQEKKAFGDIRDLVTTIETGGLEAREAEAMGAALGALDPKEAFELFTGWLHPPQSGLLSKLVAKKPKRMLLWTAAAGLIQVPGEPTLGLLREIGAQAAADEELKKHSLKSIALWRRRGAQPHG